MIFPFTKIQPKDGDRVCSCAHVKTGQRFHWFRDADGRPFEFLRPDGSEGSAQWLAICEKCFAEHDDPTECIAADWTWSGDEPAVREHRQ